MMNIDLSSHPRKLLTDTLRVLRQYQKTLRQVGKRATLVDSRLPEVLLPRVEYAPGIDDTLLRTYTASLLKRYFSEYTGTVDAVIFEPNPSLLSGLRIHYGDDIVEVSFQKCMHLLGD